MQQHQQLQQKIQWSKACELQFRNSIGRFKTQSNSEQEIYQSFNNVSSSSCRKTNRKDIHILGSSPIIDFQNEIANIKKQFNILIERNQMLMKQQIQNPEVLDEQHILNQKPFKKQIEMLRNKFNLKKDEYRKQIEQLKNQLILWERLTQQNQDTFNDYKDEVQKQLILIKKELSQYINIDENQAIKQQKILQNELSKTFDEFRNQNTFLMKQIDILKDQQSNYKQQMIKTINSHESKVNALLNELKSLNQSLFIVKSAQVPIDKASKEIQQIKTQNTILKEKLKIFQNMQNQLQTDLLQAVLDTSQQDKEQQTQNNIQLQKQHNRMMKIFEAQDILVSNVECKQCQRNRNEVLKMVKTIQKLQQQSLQKTKQFQYGKSYLSNKVMQLEQFIDLSEAEYDIQKNQNFQRLRQFQILKIKYKQLSITNLSLEQKINYLSQRLLKPSTSLSYQQDKISQSQSQPSKYYKISLDKYTSKCQQFEQKQIFYLKRISQYEQKSDELTIIINNLKKQLQIQKQTHKQQIFLLKQKLQCLQSLQQQDFKNDMQIQFNQILRKQIQQIRRLNMIIKNNHQQIYKLNYQKKEIEVKFMNLKSSFEIQKLKKTSEIKNLEINKQIHITNLSNQLNILKKTQQSLVNKLKYLAQQCKYKDMFIQKYIKSKQELSSIEIIRGDYQAINNMQQFINILHCEFKHIQQLENDKVLLIQTIRKLEVKDQNTI